MTKQTHGRAARAWFTFSALPIILTFAVPASGEEAAEQVIEEIIVTGTLIQRNKFDMGSPVEVIDAGEVLESGYTGIGPYIRDLTYTENVDTVANVLDVADGQQDSNSARFNLRGLGTSSTLTLFDGRRVLNSGAVAGILPDIALQRVEVILDGGAATYGTDAVAGVVNFIPMKDFDGWKVRGFYSGDTEGDTYEPKIAGLWGHDFGRLHIVAAAEYSERPDALYRSDRPKLLGADNDTSTTGNPGSFTGPVPHPNPFVPTLGFGLDPGCGTFNGENTDDSLRGSFPSGQGGLTIAGFPAVCAWEYGEFQDFLRPNTDFVAYLGSTFELTERMNLEFQLNYNLRESKLKSSTSTGERGSNDLMPLPASHPANPFTHFIFGTPTQVRPRNWRPFGKSGATLPSHLDKRNASTDVFEYETIAASLGLDFEIGGGWIGEVWGTVQQATTDISGRQLRRSRLAAALRGEGGPNGNQWFNPFGSASPASPDFVSGEIGQGGTANDQALVDWLYTDYDYEALDTDYWSIEGVVSGPLFELPAGELMLAVGAQYRETEFQTADSPADNTPSDVCPTEEPCGDNYNSSPYNPIELDGTSGESGVAAAFFEVDVPILDNLSLVAAGRYEDFDDLGVDAFVPKISARYQPIDSLALRASIGEGFLAPTVTEITPDPTPSCTELFTGTDPFTGGSIIGTLSCTSGNADLLPEESDIWNIGLTWQPFGDMEISLDYQEIDYKDRIIRLSTTDTLNKDLANFLVANGLTQDQYDDLDDDVAEALRADWYVTGMDPNITRDLDDESVIRVVRIPGNVASMKVNVIDFRLNWGFDLGTDAYMVMNLANTFYTKYDYSDPFGETINAIGNRNGDTDIVPPLPEYRMNLRLNWLYRNHNVGVVVKYTPAVDFDGTTGPTFVPGALDAPNRIASQTIVDVRYAYRFENLWGGSLGIAVGSNNVFDDDPQPLPVLGGMETRLQDPLGQTFYVELTYGRE